jgi:hypothetical protein
MRLSRHFYTLLLLFFALQAHATFRENLLFVTQLDGAQMLPATASSGKGMGSVMLNKKRDSLSVSLSTVGLTPTFAAIYVGGVGENGTLLFDLTDGIFGNTILKRLSGTTVKNNVSKLLTAKLYLVVGTAANPGGEVRGQIRLVSDGHFVADLKGSEAVPATTSSAFGLGSFGLAMDRSRVDFKIICQELSSNITGVQLRAGAPGATGNVLQDLSASAEGNVLAGTFTPSAALLAGLESGAVYLNVSTTNYPDGEIRAQLRLQQGITLETFSDGNQMLPPVTTAARAIGVYRLSPTMDSLFYDIVLDNVATNIDYMHLHVGYDGQDYGALQIDFTNSIVGHRARGVVKGSALSAASITKILISNLTLITHSAAYPMGEIRGHLNRFAHEGLTFQLDNTPGTASEGYGSGWAAINYSQDRAYYAWLAGNLSSTPTAARFSLVQNGVEIYDFGSNLQVADNTATATGVWSSTDAPAFLQANAFQFFQNKVQLSLATANHPDGELAGQLRVGMVYFNATSAVTSGWTGPVPQLSLAPNPAHTTVVVQLDKVVADHLQVRVLNALGQTVLLDNAGRGSGAFQTELEVADLAPGVYFLQVSDGKGLISRQFVKN